MEDLGGVFIITYYFSISSFVVCLFVGTDSLGTKLDRRQHI